MVKAYLQPTKYGQPRPADGQYTASVFKTHAEFECQGHKVLAKMAAQGAMNANGNIGVVTVTGDCIDISWEGTADTKDSCHVQKQKELLHSYEKQLSATLEPLEFNQIHPFKNNSHGYRGLVFDTHVEFGVLDKYRAKIDGDVKSSVCYGPCSVLQKNDDPLKCIIEFDDATVFMVNRYGHHTYDNLVKETVKELQRYLK